MSRHRRNRRGAGLVLSSFLVACTGTAGAADCDSLSTLVSAGMTKSEVRARMGAPDRIGILRGKDIERVAPDAEERATGRLAYFYRNGLTVWFENSKVTGATCGAARAAGPADQTEDH